MKFFLCFFVLLFGANNIAHASCSKIVTGRSMLHEKDLIFYGRALERKYDYSKKSKYKVETQYFAYQIFKGKVQENYSIYAVYDGYGDITAP